jgi:large subunit ribosomal protein L31e
LDTNEDKSLEEKEPAEEALETEEAKETEETGESAEGTETPLTEEGTEEELTEETAPKKEEEKAEAEAGEAEAPQEEEEKKERPERAPEEEEIVEERIYTIPLRRAWIAPRKKRAPRAVRIVKGFIEQHMKVESEKKVSEEEEEGGRLVISNEVNEKLWSRGIEKPPRNIRVRAVKDKEGVVTLYLAEGD